LNYYFYKNNINLRIAPLRKKLHISKTWIVGKLNFSPGTAAVNDSWMGDSLNNNLLVVNSSMGTVPIWGSSVVTEEGIAPVGGVSFQLYQN
jgi:hypothetical protein